jgi:hypothetical protein
VHVDRRDVLDSLTEEVITTPAEHAQGRRIRVDEALIVVDGHYCRA